MNKENHYDTIVIGAGMSGGWAAKEFCEQGFNTLLIERGRKVEHIKDYPTTNLLPWEFKHRGALPANIRQENPIASSCYAFKEDAILQDIQFHPVSDKILHVDFYQLSDDKEVNMEIPLVFEGSAPGVMLEGGTLMVNKRKLKVRALPINLPDSITVDISELKLGNKISSADLDSEDFTILHPENTVVCKVRTSRASMSLEEEVEGEGEGTTLEGEASSEGESSSGEE